MMKWNEGTLLEALSKPAITRDQLRAYAEASRDKNPIHLDDSYAQKAGFPTVIVHGMLTMAFMGDHVRANFPEGQFKILRLKTRFRRVTYPGDVLTCEGQVRAVSPDGVLSLQLRVQNQHGDLTSDGTAEVIEIK